MYVSMLLHIRFLVESLPAVLAGVRPGVRVYQKMGGQCAGSFESLAALFAFEDLLHAVDGPGREEDDVIFGCQACNICIEKDVGALFLTNDVAEVGLFIMLPLAA